MDVKKSLQIKKNNNELKSFLTNFCKLIRLHASLLAYYVECASTVSLDTELTLFYKSKIQFFMCCA